MKFWEESVFTQWSFIETVSEPISKLNLVLVLYSWGATLWTLPKLPIYQPYSHKQLTRIPLIGLKDKPLDQTIKHWFRFCYVCIFLVLGWTAQWASYWFFQLLKKNANWKSVFCLQWGLESSDRVEPGVVSGKAGVDRWWCGSNSATLILWHDTNCIVYTTDCLNQWWSLVEMARRGSVSGLVSTKKKKMQLI